MLRTVIGGLALLIVCGQAEAQTAERSALRWDLKSGDTLKYSFKWEFQQKADVGQLAYQDVKVLIHYTLTQTVKSVDGGTATIDAEVTSLNASADPTMMGMPMGKMGFDSANDKEGNLLRVLRHAVGKTFSFKLSPTGKVSGVKGGQAIRDAVSEAIKTEMPEMMKKMGGGGMGGGMGMMGPGMVGTLASRLTVAFDDETLTTTLGIVNHVLPDSPTTEGGSWTRDIVEKLPELGSVSFKGKYTHKGVVDGAAQIAFKPDGKVELERAEAPGGTDAQEAEKKDMATMKVLSTKVRGLASFKDNRIAVSVVDQTIEAEGEVPDMIKPQVRPGEKMVTVFSLKLTYSQDSAGGAAQNKQRF